MYYGESMYGGYYADIIKDEKHIYIHAETLKELKEQIKAIGLNVNLKDVPRWDN